MAKKKPVLPAKKGKAPPPPADDEPLEGDLPVEDGGEEVVEEAGEPEEAPARGAPSKSGRGRKAPPSGRRKAVKDDTPKQPVKLDWFGLWLLILVNVTVIGGMITWSMVAERRIDQAFLGRTYIQDYNAFSPKPRIVAFESSGTLGKNPGDVDVVVLDKGYSNPTTGENKILPVQVGDVFRPEQPLGQDGTFIEFYVFEVNATSSRAWINIGTNWDKRAKLRLNEEALNRAKIVPASGNTPGTELRREWEFQEIRKIFQIRKMKESS